MTAPLPTLPELEERILEGYEPEHGFDILVSDCRIRFRTDCEELAERVGQPLRMFMVGPEGSPHFSVDARQCTPPELELPFEDWTRDSGKVGRKDSYLDLEGGRVVRKVRTGMQFLVGKQRRVVFGDCLSNDNQVINFLNSQYMAWRLAGGWSLCHAAGVTTGTRGVAMAGVSGAGKSTLALHLLEAGLHYTSNDRLLIHRDGDRTRMSGVPKLPRINPGTALNNPSLVQLVRPERREELAKLPKAELWSLEEKMDVDVTTVFPGCRFLLEAPLDAFIVLTWAHDSEAETRIVEVCLEERPDLLKAIMKPSGPFCNLGPVSGPEDHLRVNPEKTLSDLASIPVYEISGHADFARAVEFARELLG